MKNALICRQPPHGEAVARLINRFYLFFQLDSDFIICISDDAEYEG